MPGEFFFLTFGGLGISIAGFAGLIFALDRRDHPNPAIVRWRIRHIASTGLSIAQVGLLVFPVFFLTDSVVWTIRWVSLVGLLFNVGFFRVDMRSGDAWPDDRRRRLVVGIGSVVMLGWAANVYLASVGLLMLLFVIWISAAIGTFMNAIAEFRPEDRAV